MDPRTDPMNSRPDLSLDDRTSDPTYVPTAISGANTPQINATGTDDEVEAARAEVQQTRADMSQTLDAIKEKLTPQNLVQDKTEAIRERATEMTEQALDKAGEVLSSVASTTKDAVGSAVEATKSAVGSAAGATRSGLSTVGTRAQSASGDLIGLIRDNPLPAALIGIGLFLLYQDSQRRNERNRAGRYYPYGEEDAYQYGEGGYSVQSSTRQPSTQQQSSDNPLDTAKERVGEFAGGVRDSVTGAAQSTAGAVGNAANNVTGAVSGAASMVTDRVGQVASATREGAMRAADASGHLLQDNPLLAGGLAVAAGVVVGLLVPETEVEHQWMGPTRDQIAQNVIERASETVQTAKEQIVQKVGETVDNLAGAARSNA